MKTISEPALDTTLPVATPRPRYTPAEERTNCYTHGIGTLLATLATLWMIVEAAEQGGIRHLVGVSIFGASMIFLYGVSTLYHGTHAPAAKQQLRLLDHSAIFILIAGTYTPFTLVNLHGPWGWSLLALVWTLAIVGVALEFSPLRRYRAVMVALYVVMGWSVVVAVDPLLDAVETTGLILLLLGGVAYTGGIGFYAWRSLRYHHAVWHLFVLAGSALHFFAVLHYVVPVSVA